MDLDVVMHLKMIKTIANGVHNGNTQDSFEKMCIWCVKQNNWPYRQWHTTCKPLLRPPVHIFSILKSLTLNRMCTCYFASGCISVSKCTAREKKPSHMELHLSTICIGSRLQYANADGIMPMQLSFVVYNSIPKIPSPTSKTTGQKRKTFISMLLGRRQDAR